MKQTNVRDLLLGQQDELLVKLRNDRRLHQHPSDQGDTSELDWRSVIDDFLPERYKVEKATVVDAENHTSEAIDIVVFDRQYCPLWFERGNTRYVPAESVYAVFESKQELNAENITYAGAKAASVRRLHRTNAPVVHAGGRVETPKEPFRILAGILALESAWADPLGETFERNILSPQGNRELDIGCALEHGAFNVNNDHRTGERSIVRSDPAGPLIFFLMRLFSRLQTMGTVPVIDLEHYSRSLEA
jgi:hypothetical protein